MDDEPGHVPVTVSVETDKRRVPGLLDGEVGLRFTREFDPGYTESEVIRLTPEEVRKVFLAAHKYLAATLG